MEAAGGKLDLNDMDNSALVDSFCEITSSTREEAAFYLESHQWDLDSAVSTFLDNDNASAAVVAAAADSSAAADDPVRPSRAAVDTPSPTDSPGESLSPDYSPSQSPSRSRSRSSSPAPATVSRVSRLPYRLRSRGADDDNKKNKKPRTDDGSGTSRSGNRRGITTLSDLNRAPAGSDTDDEDDDEPQEYYTGGQKSGMLVQDPKKKFDADAIFDQARNSGAVHRPEDSARASSASRSFAGTGRLLSGETVQASPQPVEFVNHTITLWRNGFTVNDGPLRRLNDPANAEFLESVKKSECPTELEPEDRRTQVHLNLVRRDENYTKQEPPKKKAAFKGVGRTLADDASASERRPVPDPLTTAPVPSSGLTVDSSSPETSIQLRLADGTRMVSRFNLHHTIRDVRGFIMASRPGESQDFQLQTMGFPPKQLTDPDQTIQDAGIANSVVIQKLLDRVFFSIRNVDLSTGI